MSKSSARSGGSSSSYTSNRRSTKGLGSFKRNMDKLLSTYLTSRDVDDALDVNPYDALFDRNVVRRIVAKKSYIEKLNFSDFRNKVKWESKFGFPEFLIDLVIYLVNFNIREYLQIKTIKD